MKNYNWVMPLFFGGLFILVICIILSWGEGRNQGIVYCMETPDNCKIEYSYLKLKLQVTR